MKKHLTKIAIGTFLALSLFCYSYLNSLSPAQAQEEFKYEQLNQTKDKMLASFKSATLVFGKVVDFITKRDVG